MSMEIPIALLRYLYPNTNLTISEKYIKVKNKEKWESFIEVSYKGKKRRFKGEFCTDCVKQFMEFMEKQKKLMVLPFPKKRRIL